MANQQQTAHMHVRHPDGSIESVRKWLCTSPIHYRNILVDVTMHYTSDPGSRFVHESLSLNAVIETLEIRAHSF